MSEFSSPASLTPDGGSSLLFNQWVSASGYEYRLRITGPIDGIDAPVIRSTVEDAPGGTPGFLIYPIVDGGVRFVVEGEIEIRGAATDAAYTTARNTIEALIRTTLQASKDVGAQSVWSWTPTGLTAHSLGVVNETELRMRGGQIKSFLFGLVSSQASITVAD